MAIWRRPARALVSAAEPLLASRRKGCARRLLPPMGRRSIDVKDRPVVQVRDLPIAGRVTYLVWCNRRYCCRGCGRSFTESHPELPARQRVTRRLRRRLFERVRGGAAHAEVARCERTTRCPQPRSFGKTPVFDRT